MNQYTKGEWKVISGGASLRYIRVMSDNPHTNNAKIAVLEMSGVLGIARQLDANAHLIAAAPRLFEWIKAKADNGDKDAQCFLATLNI